MHSKWMVSDTVVL